MYVNIHEDNVPEAASHVTGGSSREQVGYANPVMLKEITSSSACQSYVLSNQSIMMIVL